jgi:hypothetical protein
MFGQDPAKLVLVVSCCLGCGLVRAGPAMLSSEKKELLRRDYARAMSDKLCD